MREIKFRAWDKHTKEMYQDVTYDKESEGGVRPWIFMQYTGLLDKNGTEIYEGDIVRFAGHRVYGVVEWIDNAAMFALRWDKETAKTKREEVSDGMPVNLVHGGIFNPWGVIGNIHQHPALLPGGPSGKKE